MKSKKLEPSSKLLRAIERPATGRAVGQRIEHLICHVLEEINTINEDNWWIVDRNIGKRGLSSTVSWERTQALKELFLCARTEDTLQICEACSVAAPEDGMEYDAIEGWHTCSKCQESIEDEAQFRHDHRAEAMS